MSDPIHNLTDGPIALGPVDWTLLPDYLRWANDFAVQRTAADILLPVTREDQEAWFARVSPGSDASTVRFTIFEASGGRAIGLTNLHRIDYRHGTAEFGIMIGEADCRGRGYGGRVTRMMLRYAFGSLGLHNVMLRVFSINPAAVRAYENAGFREFGRRRECRLIERQRVDEIFMECLAAEFLATDRLEPDMDRTG